MHSLASLFVSLVLVANSAFPKADLPRVLGVQIADRGGNETESVETQKEEEKETPEPLIERKSLSSNDFIERSREAIKNSKDKIRKTLEVENENEDENENSSESGKKKEEFRKKLSELKDEAKKEKLSNLDENLGKVNTNTVNRWNKLLERLTAILEKIKTRTDEESTKGVDVTSILAAISNAETKIADAKKAVNDQSDNVYTITIGSESNLGQSVKSAISGLKTDLKSTEIAVKDAKNAVVAVLKLLKTLTPESSPSPTEAPSI